MKLEGAVAVVIGGANGIGKCYCEALLQNGTKVLLCDIQVEAGQAAVDELSTDGDADTIAFRKCDGVKESEIRESLLAAKSRWGRLDIIINHVGVLNESAWERMIQINMGSTILSTKVTEEILGKNNGGPGGVLIHTSSRSGLHPSPLGPIYCATKAAIIHYTRAMMHPAHYKRHGLRIMTMCPGMTRTAFALELDQEKMANMYETTRDILKQRDETNTWIKLEWVGAQLIRLLRDDIEMAGVAAEVSSDQPMINYQGEWKDTK